MESVKITHCRVCGSADLIPILDLGNLAISDFVTSQKHLCRSPLTLVLCNPKDGCGLLQLGHTIVDQDILYRQYWYTSGVNATMKRALKDVANYSQRKVKLYRGDIVMDIGANDGTLLSFFPQMLTRVGVEPARNLKSKLQGNCEIYVPEYFSKKTYKKYVGMKPAKLITSLAMFYDLDDPVSLARDIKSCLSADGIWVNQMSYLGDMIAKTDYPNICHEHVTYYSLATFVEVLKRANLKLLEVSVNNVNGGSIRTVVTHADSLLDSNKPILDETRLQRKTTCLEFAKHARRSKRELHALISKYVKEGKKIYVYGASTKGNTLLQYCDLKYPMILGAFDRNRDKVGKYTVATNIPIYAEEDMKKVKPDVLLVLPWHFKDEFVKREQKFLKDGGTMVFPLPKLEIISN